MNLREWNEKIQKVNPVKAFYDYVNDNPTIFIDMLKEQMSEGKSGVGFITPGYKSTAYQKQKLSQNPSAGGHPDLYDTGDFYAGFKIETAYRTTEVDIKFYSTDEKNTALTRKYSFIWTFNDESISKLKPIILRDFKNYLL